MSSDHRKPHSSPTRRSADLTGRTKEDLVDAMRDVLAQYPGISFNFSQPIKDSVEEAVSGVHGQVVLKTYGRSEEHTSELQSRRHLVRRLLLETTQTRPPLRN